MFRPSTAGLGAAVSAGVNISAETGHLESANVIVPVTFVVDPRVHFNINAGWLYTRAIQRHDIFYGAQIEFAVSPAFVLMVEGFGRNRGPLGDQVGMRWTPGGGGVDVDLLFGNYIDGINARAVTLGLTIRR